MTQADIDASYRAWYRSTWPKHVLAAPVPVYAAEPPSHQLTTIDMITREALRLYRNSNWLMEVTKKFDEECAKAGAKTGLHFRQPLTSAPLKIS